MREKRTPGLSSTKQTRTTGTREPNIKYFLVFEGVKTEPLYFKELKQHQQTIGLSPLIELIEIERTHSEEGWSHPSKILELVLFNFKDPETITYQTLCNSAVDCLYFSDYFKTRTHYIDTFEIFLNTFIETTLERCKTDFVEDKEKTIQALIEYLKKERPFVSELVATHLSDTLQEEQITYDPQVDKICLIVDRDKHSFKENQYDEVIQSCENNNVKLYVSNPCFEFWLLLHFNDVFSIDKEQLLANNKISSKKRFVEGELRKCLGCYSKNKYNASDLMVRIPQAIQNEKSFCETLPELKDQLGCNIGLLIEEMKSIPKNT